MSTGGPRSLWDDVERAHAEWDRLGRPGWDRLGLTITSDGTHLLWCDGPGHIVRNLSQLRASSATAL